MKEVYAKSVMPCWRGLCTSHLHRPFTIYPWQRYEQFLKLARISGSFFAEEHEKPSIDAEVFGDESFCQRVVEHRLAAVVLPLQLGQLATLLFTAAAAYQLTDRYKA